MNRAASSLACLALLAPLLSATSINFVGTESGNEVQNWSNTAVAKTMDLNGDNRFGGAGYYQIRPAAAGTSFSNNVNVGNDLGITLDFEGYLPDGLPLGQALTDSVKPLFLSADPLGAEGIFYNFDYFPQFRNPDAFSFVQQGSLSVTINNILNDGSFGWNEAFSFTIGEAATFRIGVAVDTVDGAERAPNKVSISKVTTVGESLIEKFSTTLNRNGVPDMVFFDVEGNAGDRFSVRLWQTPNVEMGMDPVAFALVTFDQALIPTLSYTQVDGKIILSWEQNIPGWILESSTDLGVGDDWGPVPYPNNNNSVTVPMAGVPKNFFRLKKSP